MKQHKQLSAMSNNELWTLFPIILKDYNPDYPLWYSEEKAVLINIVGEENIKRINHIGSTAVPGMISKPTIDILLEITNDCDIDRLISILQSNGYLHTEQPNNPPPHLMFMKGYTLKGFAERVFHLHVRYNNDWDELYFRDYLQMHPDIAQQYGMLKNELRLRFEHDRDKYTQEKTSFIYKYTILAKEEYGNKYVSLS